MLLDAALIAANLAIWGAHAVLPWQAAGLRQELRRVWALAAAPLLLASVIATLARIGAAPDAALAQGIVDPFGGGSLSRLVAVAGSALLAADLLLALAWRRFEPAAWRLVGGLGTLALPLVALAAERLRVGEGPWTGAAALATGLAVRAALALAAAELIAGPRWLTPAAGAALPFYWLALAGPVRSALAAEGMTATLAAAALCLLVSRALPARLRRPALAAGVLLAALFLARAAAIPLELPQRMLPLPPLGPS